MATARALESKDKLDAARKIYEQLIVELPDRYQPYHRLGLVADQQRRHREAAALYEQALQLKPLDARILNDLGYCFYLQGQLDKAEMAISKAISLAPSVSRFRNNLGLVLGQQGRLDEALESFRQSGSEADAQYNLAFVLASQGKTELAKRCFRAALAADPKFDKARKALSSFESYDNQPEEFQDNDWLADDRGWIPYNEQPSTTTNSATSGQSATALQARARALMNNRLASQSQAPSELK